MAPAGACRFEELGRLQFDGFCRALIGGATEAEWQTTGSARVLVAADGAIVPGTERRLPGPTLVMTAWLRNPHDADPVVATIESVASEWRHIEPRSLLLLTNADAAPPQSELAAEVLDAGALSRLVRSGADLRALMPSLLGIYDAVVSGDVAARSTADLEAAAALARVFVPTNAYAATLDVLERFGFAVLTGPPEMGKTAIARMVGLAKASDGWEFHECIHPEELWARFARDRAQVFVADDAFGSTEYRPEAAERWALELDRVLRAMDSRHWLVWTSRPTPLQAGLRRIHREHRVERFPQPAQIHVDASALDVEEKALILFRHAKAARLSDASVEAVRANGWRIVSHEHFTPERIRRFIGGRALRLSEQREPERLEVLIASEIREPTTAMESSFRALAPEHRALLVAMLDVPPGPVHERDLAAAVRRHSTAGFAEQPSALLDRLSDHFLHISTNETVTWVHPSWRDLVIDEVASSADARQSFLRACSADGLLLALSIGGGGSGTRELPLLVTDGDWDAAGDLVARVVPELDEPATTRLLISLAEALDAEAVADALELEALATLVVELLARGWNEQREPIPLGLLGRWLELRSSLRAQALLDFAPTWIEHLPSTNADPTRAGDVAELDEWLTLAALLRDHAPAALDAFGFPDRQEAHVSLFLERVTVRRYELGDRYGVVRTLDRIARLMPALAERARDEMVRVSESFRPEPQELYVPRPLPPDLNKLLAPRPRDVRSEERLVHHVLRDL